MLNETTREARKEMVKNYNHGDEWRKTNFNVSLDLWSYVLDFKLFPILKIHQ